MSDLVEFLMARIAEDEEVARAAQPAYWYSSQKSVEAGDPDGGRGEDFMHFPTNTRADAEHIARWSPARALAECEAKRSMIRRIQTYAGALEDGQRNGARPRFGEGYWNDLTARWSEWDMAARFMAAPYADHPDYREEWRP